MDLDKLLPKAKQRDAPQDYELWPEHAMAWAVYQGCATQWNKTAGWNSVIWDGLNYLGVEVVMRRYQVPQERESEVFCQVQVLERETLEIINKRRN